MTKRSKSNRVVRVAVQALGLLARPTFGRRLFAGWSQTGRLLAGNTRAGRLLHSDAIATRILALLLTSCLLLCLGVGGSLLAGAAQEPEKPATATTNDLLRAVPFDRITLIDGTVLEVEPISPRPLAVYDPVKEREKKRQARVSKSAIPAEGNIIPGKKTVLDQREETGEAAIEKVKLHLLQAAAGEERDFEVKRPSIQKVEYFEDMLLTECDRLVLARDFSRAFECCLRVQTRNPGWKGLADRVNSVLFAEGSRALIEGDGERGLRLLRELLGRKRDHPGLLEVLGEAYGKRIQRAIELGLYAKGRRILHELEEMAPEHLVVKDMRSRFIIKATDYVKRSESFPAPERLDALTLALRVWPRLEGAAGLYGKAFAALPTLEVAVVDVASPPGPWIHAPADERLTRLLYRPILSGDDEDARRGKDSQQLAAGVESSELGRRLLIRIRNSFLWSDGSRPVSAVDVARDLIDRTDPNSPRYLARWADLLDRVEAPDDTRVELRLHRPPLKAGPWLLGPVGPAHAGVDGRVATSAEERPFVTDGLYRVVAATGDSVELRLRDNAGGQSDQPITRIKRMRETRLPRVQAAVGALLRGDVTMIAHVPPDQVAALEVSSEIKIGRYAQPVVHLIALDGRNPALRNRALRRGLSYAIDRKSMLEDRVLKHPATDADCVADGPFPKGNYADAPGVKPLGYNPWLARMLVAAAVKELGGAPIQLNFEYPGLPEAQRVVGKLVDTFRQSGVEVKTIELPESQLESELRSGRRFDMAYRVVRCDEPVMDAGTLLCPGYDAPPGADALASVVSPPVLLLLLDLERAVDWPSGRGLAIQIDRESRDELPVIPLWQLTDHYAWRDRLKGPAPKASWLYQGIETWEISPWFAKDPWEKP
jgi:peptide/nickel transport system substrate-binding protein